MKTVCDHCGGALTQGPYPINNIVWCSQCVQDDLDLLENSGVNLAGQNGEYSWVMSWNIEKVKAIPPKGSKKSLPKEPLPTIAEVLVQVRAEEKAEEKIDFHKYNTVIPGSRGSHS
jgi:hypothetical protein